MENNCEEKACLCALNRLFGYEPQTLHQLIGLAGSASAVFNFTSAEKLEIFGPYSRISPLLRDEEVHASERELARLEDEGCGFITMNCTGYPGLLKECVDAPVGLYYKGGTPPEEVFGARPQIAVVGTRDISLYGKEWCRRIVEAMSRATHKPLIVSGFAFGTDIIAHLSALEFGIPTVAVLPTGIDDVYPSRHRRFADRMVSTPGCAFVTDYPPGTAPKPINFIRRNRIIAGICSGTILIESKIKGGGMITARLASSYGRDLFVLPGRADDIRSQGCNALLREKLAEPVTDTVHFLDDLGLGGLTKRKTESIEGQVVRCFKQKLDDESFKELESVLECIRRDRGVSIEGICPQVNLPYLKAAQYAEMLENEGIISIDLIRRCCINVKNS